MTKRTGRKILSLLCTLTVLLGLMSVSYCVYRALGLSALSYVHILTLQLLLYIGAAFTPLPVVGVPMKTSDLGGMDSLLSMVQMPKGIPVACVAVDGADNAAILAVQMLGTGDEAARQQIIDFKQQMAEA